MTYVAPDSPGAKAGLQKNDVLVELEGQLLVHPAQLRKLVQVHKEGDTVELVFYRAGKKQTVSATLGRPPPDSAALEDEHPWKGELGQFALRQFATCSAGTPAATRHEGTTADSLGQSED